VPDLSFISYQTNSPNTQCTIFHNIAPPAIKALHPNLVIVTSEAAQDVRPGVAATPAQWLSGWKKTFKSLYQVGVTYKMIGDIPQWPNDYADCLAAHMNNVSSCSTPVKSTIGANNGAEKMAALDSGAAYIPTAQWICAKRCEPVIANIRVFYNEYHLSATYEQYVSTALQQALGFPTT